MMARMKSEVGEPLARQPLEPAPENGTRAVRRGDGNGAGAAPQGQLLSFVRRALTNPCSQWLSAAAAFRAARCSAAGYSPPCHWNRGRGSRRGGPAGPARPTGTTR